MISGVTANQLLAQFLSNSLQIVKLIVRLLRKRIILAIIFTLSFTYCLLSLIRDRKASDESYHIEHNADIDKLNIIARFDIFKDNQSDVMLTDVNKVGLKCRNSIQGKVLIADDRGFVCYRKDVTLTGCCDERANNAKLYSCDTCQDHGCCAIYEFCISCCMEPNKKPLLTKIVGKTSETFNILMASITDHFELCLTKCRTSSASVQHENSYRDPKAKHCYGELNEKTN